jgi:hypothetical protein
MWCVVVCDQETSWYEEAIVRAGLQSQKKKNCESFDFVSWVCSKIYYDICLSLFFSFIAELLTIIHPHLTKISAPLNILTDSVD